MMRYEYPTPDETLALRDRLIETFGGAYSPRLAALTRGRRIPDTII